MSFYVLAAAFCHVRNCTLLDGYSSDIFDLFLSKRKNLQQFDRKDIDKYKTEFYNEYALFLKEGVCQDFDSQQPLSKLLLFETSKGMSGELVSLDEYVSRCPPEQKNIYFLFAPSRELALQSPYMEGFAKHKREVIFIYSGIDEFVMANLKTFEGRNLLSADRSELELPKEEENDTKKEEEEGNKDDSSAASNVLSKLEATEFCSWFQTTLKSKVAKCTTTDRLSSSPAVITDNESGALRNLMRILESQEGGSSPSAMPLPKQTVLINPNHEIIVGIHHMKEKEPLLAEMLAEQILDNCLVAAGLLNDGRSMLPRLNDLMLCVVKSSVDVNDQKTQDDADVNEVEASTEKLDDAADNIKEK